MTAQRRLMTKSGFLALCAQQPLGWLEWCAAQPGLGMTPAHVTLVRLAIRRRRRVVPRPHSNSSDSRSLAFISAPPVSPT